MIGNYNFKEIEDEVRIHWKSIGLLNRLQEKNVKGKPFFLLDGPPYANNVPHVGHIRNTVYKDFYIRHAFMQGKNVLFQPGFDTHGLPIENMVEKKLDLKSKKDIEKLGIKKFCDTCKQNATNYKDEWLMVYDKLGSWYSWKEPYLTYRNEYIESVWWSFKQLWDKGMVYEGKKPVFWCPKCETALAGYEATDKYMDVQDPLIIIKFKVQKSENDYLLVFTTTPWTLPSNVALVVKGDEMYVKAKTKHGNLILAKNLIKLLDELKIGYELLEEFKGEKLNGLKYEPVIDAPTQHHLKKNSHALKVYLSIPILKERVASKVQSKKGLDSSGDLFEHFVSVDEGTGIVHCAPGHGKTDNLVGKYYNLPEVSPLDDQCKFTEEVSKYKGVFVKDSDLSIIEDLKASGSLLYSAKLTHSYPLCWRCNSPLIYRMSNQWFLKIEPIKEEMLSANEKVNWQPGFAGERFRSWVANADDWNFSRQRYWGIPIPIWKSEDGETKVVGSKAELEKYLGKKLPEDFDLHTISDLKMKSSNGKNMKTVGDIFDVWFDSGSAPFAAFHYPFENKKLFEAHYPVDRINESQDQIRGWFYSLMFCGVATFGKAPYKTISMPGWVLDKNGEKMSKSLGNFISAEDAINNLGADNVRFYYCSDVDPSSLAKFNEETVKQETTRVHNILWNLHKLLVTQVSAAIASGDDVKLSKNISELNLQTEDKWILSRLASTIKLVKEYYDDFRLHLAGRAMYEFVLNDLSRTYIQIVRERLEDETVPLNVLYYCLMQYVRLSAPISPHISDKIYCNIKDELKDAVTDELFESVHLEHIPGTDLKEKKNITGFIDESLEGAFVRMMGVVTAILAARDSAMLSIRWPVREVFVDTGDAETIDSLEKFDEVLLRFVNSKALTIKKMNSKVDAKLNYKALGIEFGQETGDVASLALANINMINKNYEAGDSDIKLGKYVLKKEHFNIVLLPPEGFSSGEFKEGRVFISKTLDEELAPEGYMREVVRRIQALRKKMNLTKQDRIKLALLSENELITMLTKFESVIKDKVGAGEMLFTQNSLPGYSDISEDKIRGKVVKIAAQKI